MKKLAILFILTVGILPSAVAQQDYDQQQYEKKINTYTRMRSGGFTMLGIGAGLTVAGTVLIATIPSDYWHYDYNGDYYNANNDLKLVGGIIGIALGVGLTAGGITMSSIASHKLRRYREKLSGLSLNMIYTPNEQGLKLTYRF